MNNNQPKPGKFSWRYALLFLASLIVAIWIVFTYVPDRFFQILFFVILGVSIAIGLGWSYAIKKKMNK